MTCKHKTKHTRYVKGSPSIVYANILFGSRFTTEIPFRNSEIITYCADCGEKLNTVDLHDYEKLYQKDITR